MDTLITLTLLAGLVWFWVDSLRAREIALKGCAAFCRETNVQLLDQTVRIARLRLGRNARGRIQVRRFYAYDFSIDGQDRWFGIAILLGRQLEYIRMEHPNGPIIFDPPETRFGSPVTRNILRSLRGDNLHK